MSQPTLIIFARQPIPGETKTRLQPDYSPEKAAEIAAFMIRATVELAVSALPCDVPHCGWDIIDQANDWLARGKNVLGPTEDGGYYFIGLQEARPELFEAMPWGSN